MAIKICMWFLIVMCGSLAIVCFVLASSCLCTGKIAEGCLIGWIGLIPSSLTAFAWWAKDQLKELL